MNLVILGAPGSGKGTQAIRLAERGNLKHISSGDLLREAVAKQTEIGKQVESIMASGKLVPDDVVLELVTEALSADEARNGWVLDGYPRTADQAERLEDVLSANRELIDAVLYLEVNADAVVERLAKRGRGDDTPETVQRRLEVFDEEMAPLLEFYELRYDIHRVDGSKSIDEVTDAIVELIDL